MINIKILSINEYSAAMEILHLKEKAGGMSKPSDTKLDEIYLKYFAGESPQFIAIGYLEDDKLISWVSLSFIISLNSNFTNTWNITGMFSLKFDNMFSFNRPEIGTLIKTAFEIAEHRHCWKYYYTISTSHQYLYDKLWKKNKYVQTGRYSTEIEYVIAPLDLYLKKYYADLIGNRKYKEEFVLKRRILNSEFRIRYDTLHPLELLATHKIYPDYTQFNFDYSIELLTRKKILNIAKPAVNVKPIDDSIEIISELDNKLLTGTNEFLNDPEGKIL